MTRKDYELIAQAIREQVEALQGKGDNPPWEPPVSLLSTAVIRAVAVKLAIAFQQDNPRFNRAWFLLACGF